MDLIEKIIANVVRDDWRSVFYGKAHNIGAGGVYATAEMWGKFPACGACAGTKFWTEKRRKQMESRHRRAFGTNF